MRASVAGIYDEKRQVLVFQTPLWTVSARRPASRRPARSATCPLIDGDWKYLGGTLCWSSPATRWPAGLLEGIRSPATISGLWESSFVAGRDFTAAERAGKDLVAMVDDVFARQSGLGARNRRKGGGSGFWEIRKNATDRRSGARHASGQARQSEPACAALRAPGAVSSRVHDVRRARSRVRRQPTCGRARRPSNGSIPRSPSTMRKPLTSG